MVPLDVNPCADGESICDTIYGWTGNATLADYSDVLIGKPLAIIGLFVLGVLVRWLLLKVVARIVHRAAYGVIPERMLTPSVAARRGQRAETMGELFKSIITGLLVAVFGTIMLSELGINIAPIVASAGILGVALGFGAQSLVKDYLSGIFMILEDQFGVGDTIDVGEAVGIVEAVTMRVVRVRDINGTVWYVRNGEILRVGNQSQNWSRTVLDISVAYSEDIPRVDAVLEDIAHAMWEDPEFRGKVIEEPSVWGVQDLGPDSVTMRVVLKTAPGDQFGVAREMRQRIKARFDEEGIEIPFPQHVVWHRQEPAKHDPAPAERTSDEVEA